VELWYVQDPSSIFDSLVDGDMVLARNNADVDAFVKRYGLRRHRSATLVSAAGDVLVPADTDDDGDATTPTRTSSSFRVTVSTIHSVKGLQSQRVFLLHASRMKTGNQERNLMYVALTRGCHSLVLVEQHSTPAPPSFQCNHLHLAHGNECTVRYMASPSS
jgi:superfamily I DNA/RNA helicase